MHTPAGLTTINARWQARNAASSGAPSPAPAVAPSPSPASPPARLCYGCGKSGHFIAECPAPHKTQLQVQNESHAVETDEVVPHGSAAIVNETSNPKRRRIETLSHLEALKAFNQQTALEQVKEYFKGETY